MSTDGEELEAWLAVAAPKPPKPDPIGDTWREMGMPRYRRVVGFDCKGLRPGDVVSYNRRDHWIVQIERTGGRHADTVVILEEI